jgi:hypothetical protein
MLLTPFSPTLYNLMTGFPVSRQPRPWEFHSPARNQLHGLLPAPGWKPADRSPVGEVQS